MQIIALYGHAQCGKSSTLNILREILRREGKSISLNGPHNHDRPETFDYHGRIICVAPGGDTKEVVQSNLDYFVSKKCDVGVTASRTKGGPVNALLEFKKHNNVKITWIQKSYEYNLSEKTKKICNNETAEYLFNLILKT